MVVPANLERSGWMQLARSTSRAHPLLLGAPMSEATTLDYRLPAGYEPVELPPPTDLATPFGTYRMHWSLDAGILRGERLLSISAPRIEPADYPAFREFVTAAEQADRRVLGAEGEATMKRILGLVLCTFAGALPGQAPQPNATDAVARGLLGGLRAGAGQPGPARPRVGVDRARALGTPRLRPADLRDRPPDSDPSTAGAVPEAARALSRGGPTRLRSRRGPRRDRAVDVAQRLSRPSPRALPTARLGAPLAGDRPVRRQRRLLPRRGVPPRAGVPRHRGRAGRSLRSGAHPRRRTPTAPHSGRPHHAGQRPVGMLLRPAPGGGRNRHRGLRDHRLPRLVRDVRQRRRSRSAESARSAAPADHHLGGRSAQRTQPPAAEDHPERLPRDRGCGSTTPPATPWTGSRSSRTRRSPRHAAPMAGDGDARVFATGIAALRAAAGDAQGEQRQLLLLAAALASYRVGDRDLGIRLHRQLDRDPPAEGPVGRRPRRAAIAGVADPPRDQTGASPPHRRSPAAEVVGTPPLRPDAGGVSRGPGQARRSRAHSGGADRERHRRAGDLRPPQPAVQRNAFRFSGAARPRPMA